MTDSDTKPFDLLGTRALARALGVTPAAVVKARREGRITPAAIQDGRPMYDVERVRLEWRTLASRRSSQAAVRARLRIKAIAGNMTAKDRIEIGLAMIAEAAIEAFTGKHDTGHQNTS